MCFVYLVITLIWSLVSIVTLLSFKLTKVVLQARPAREFGLLVWSSLSLSRATLLHFLGIFFLFHTSSQLAH